MREYAAGAKPEQRNRNCEKCKVVEQHHRKQPGQGQLKQKGGEAAQGHSPEHRGVYSTVSIAGRNQEGWLTHCERFAGNAASLTEGKDNAFTSAVRPASFERPTRTNRQCRAR